MVHPTLLWSTATSLLVRPLWAILSCYEGGPQLRAALPPELAGKSGIMATVITVSWTYEKNFPRFAQRILRKKNPIMGELCGSSWWRRRKNEETSKAWGGGGIWLRYRDSTAATTLCVTRYVHRIFPRGFSRTASVLVESQSKFGRNRFGKFLHFLLSVIINISFAVPRNVREGEAAAALSILAASVFRPKSIDFHWYGVFPGHVGGRTEYSNLIYSYDFDF